MTLWYISRATGLVDLLLLTTVMVLGIVVASGGKLPGLPRFAGTGLHRNLALLAICFTVLHVVTAVLDSYVSIPLTSAVIPFASRYESLALALGAVSFDLMLTLIVTSLLRRHMSPVVWRVTHWFAYACWPVAFLHSILSSKDMRHDWMLLVAVVCGAVVVIAAGWRLVDAGRQVPRAERVSVLLAGLRRPVSAARHVSAEGSRR
jgi:sulfoxide reductase heme-binding subunit YedZ